MKLLLIIIIAFAVSACEISKETQKNSPEKSGQADAKKVEKAEKKDETKPANIAKFDSPTAAIKAFVEAVKAKDEAKIKSALSSSTIKGFSHTAKIMKKSFYEVLTMEDEEEMKTLPEMRNEKIDGDKATLEVKDKKSNKWDAVPFVKEDGSWKLAFFSEEQLKEMEKEMK